MEHIILVVEDCAESVPALEIALQKHFFCIVEHHERGRGALAAFEREPQAVLGLITDLNLPDMDGWEIIRQIRREPVGAQLPVIAISANPNPQARLQALEAGADAFFPKPYSLSEVCRCLKGIIHAKKNPDTTSTYIF